MALRINLQVIPHREQRYETVGDWWWDEEGVLQIRSSKMDNPRFEQLVLLRELVEVLLADWTRPRETSRDYLLNRTEDHDKSFELARVDEFSESGYEPKSPVYREHMIASAFEHIAALLMRVNYNEYTRAVAALSK